MHPAQGLYLAPWSLPSVILLHTTVKSKAYATTTAELSKIPVTQPSPRSCLALRMQVKLPWMSPSESSVKGLDLTFLAKIPATRNYQLSFHSFWMLVYSRVPLSTSYQPQHEAVAILTHEKSYKTWKQVFMNLWDLTEFGGWRSGGGRDLQGRVTL